MKKYSRILLLLLSSGNIYSQQLSPTVVSSSGGFYSTISGMLSFTSGEMTSVETYISPSSILTQGFQQAWDFGTFIQEYPNQEFSFSIYPNPSDGIFYLLTAAEENKQIDVKVLDILGRAFLSGTLHHQGKITVHPIDVSFALPGTYLLSIIVIENNTSPSKPYIRKLQIIR